MRTILCCPHSSAGIERLFSLAALVHTQFRNLLTNDRVTKLVWLCSILDGLRKKMLYQKSEKIEEN